VAFRFVRNSYLQLNTRNLQALDGKEAGDPVFGYLSSHPEYATKLFRAMTA
jgi:hypothetical protein